MAISFDHGYFRFHIFMDHVRTIMHICKGLKNLIVFLLLNIENLYTIFFFLSFLILGDGVSL
jgi:hypothetical protein